MRSRLLMVLLATALMVTMGLTGFVQASEPVILIPSEYDIIVAQDGSGDHTTIQAALDMASPGEDIWVEAGTYAEALTIRVPVGLWAEEGVLVTTSGSTTIDVTISGVTLSGFSAENLDSKGTVLRIHDADDPKISNLTLSGPGANTGSRCLALEDSSHGIYTDLELSECGTLVWISSAELISIPDQVTLVRPNGFKLAISTPDLQSSLGLTFPPELDSSNPSAHSTGNDFQNLTGFSGGIGARMVANPPATDANIFEDIHLSEVSSCLNGFGSDPDERYDITCDGVDFPMLSGLTRTIPVFTNIHGAPVTTSMPAGTYFDISHFIDSDGAITSVQTNFPTDVGEVRFVLLRPTLGSGYQTVASSSIIAGVAGPAQHTVSLPNAKMGDQVAIQTLAPTSGLLVGSASGLFTLDSTGNMTPAAGNGTLAFASTLTIKTQSSGDPQPGPEQSIAPPLTPLVSWEPMTVLVLGANSGEVSRAISNLAPAMTEITFTGQWWTPTAAELAAYDAVLLFQYYGWPDYFGMGTTLFDYVMGGGGLVLGSWHWSWGNWGPLLDVDIFQPCTPWGGWAGTDVGSYAAHELMTGVGYFQAVYGAGWCSLEPGATGVGNWNSGRGAMAGYREVGGGKIVGVTVAHGRSPIWGLDSNYDRLMQNAFHWVGPVPYDALIRNIQAPDFIDLNAGTDIEVEVYNRGTETLAAFQVNITVDGTTVVTLNVPTLLPKQNHTLSWFWAPSSSGFYTLGADIVPFVGENITTNNHAEKDVQVMLKPVIEWDPTSFYQVLGINDTATQQLTIDSLGSAMVYFNITVDGPGPIIGIINVGGAYDYRTIMNKLGIPFTDIGGHPSLAELDGFDIIILDGWSCSSSHMDADDLANLQMAHDNGASIWISFDDISSCGLEPAMRALTGNDDIADNPDDRWVTIVEETFPNGSPIGAFGQTWDFKTNDLDYLSGGEATILDNKNHVSFVDRNGTFVMYLGSTIRYMDSNDEDPSDALPRLFKAFYDMWIYVNRPVILGNLTGGIPIGEEMVIDVTFDSAGLPQGIYQYNITITTNDPEIPVVVIPVTLNVTCWFNDAWCVLDPAPLVFTTIHGKSGPIDLSPYVPSHPWWPLELTTTPGAPNNGDIKRFSGLLLTLHNFNRLEANTVRIYQMTLTDGVNKTILTVPVLPVEIGTVLAPDPLFDIYVLDEDLQIDFNALLPVDLSNLPGGQAQQTTEVGKSIADYSAEEKRNRFITWALAVIVLLALLILSWTLLRRRDD